MDVEVTFPGGVRVDAAFGRFTVRTDQPVEHGGEGSAPGPYDLFVASVAACAGYYALAFCRARSLATDGLGVHLSTETDPQTKLASSFRILLRLPPEFPERHRAGILRAVENCKVKKTMAAAPTFDVAFA